MSSQADLHRAVQTTLASKRLGQPVFVRYLWNNSEKPETVLPRLTHLVAVTRTWLGQRLERIHALGSVDGGQVSLTLEFREGASALVCWSSSRPPGSGVDVMVIGNRGALYHDAGSGNLWDEPAAPEAAAPDARLMAVLERALRSGKPESAGEGAKP